MESVIGADGKVKISKQKLSDKGFNFNHTHQHQTLKGSVYKLCYDYGYLPIENDLIYVIKWETLHHNKMENNCYVFILKNFIK